MSNALRFMGIAALLLALPVSEVSAASNVLFIFDASGSMKKEVGGASRFDAAVNAFGQTVLGMPQSATVGLLMYGARRPKDCSDIEMVSPIGEKEPAALVLHIAGLVPKGETPIAEAILQGAKSFTPAEGDKNSIVLLTDGIEECGGDPCAAAEAVAQLGIDLKVNIVGFTLEPQQRAAIECMAAITGGKYYDAADGDALLQALGEAAQEAVVAQAEPPAPPPEPEKPAEKARKVVFSDDFDGDDVSSENWEIVAANTDAYIVEKGSLLTISAAAGGLANPELPNLFKLKQDLPEGDYAVTIKFKVDFSTGTEAVTVGLFDDPENFIAATFDANFRRYEADSIETHITKVSKGQSTGFSSRLMETSGTGYDDVAAYLADLNAIEQPITLKLVKVAREFHAEANLAGQKDESGNPIWMITEPVPTLRPPKALVLTTSQTGADGGESSFFIDSVTIDVPEE
jgi:Ca-activated chloride channel family protein